MNLFYHPSIAPGNDQEIAFSKEESRHIIKALRKKEGDFLEVTNGDGYIFSTEIISLTPKECIVSARKVTVVPPSPYNLHMAVAPTKNNDRYEWFLEKATEIGIQQITPIICEHSERKVVKKERFERIIESAMKQSLKAHKPKLDDACSFTEFMKSIENKNHTKLIAYCGEGFKSTLKEVVSKGTDIIILIGPEGDFSYKEFELALANDFKGITLGNSRLRTETAAITACHAISFLNFS